MAIGNDALDCRTMSPPPPVYAFYALRQRVLILGDAQDVLLYDLSALVCCNLSDHVLDIPRREAHVLWMVWLLLFVAFRAYLHADL